MSVVSSTSVESPGKSTIDIMVKYLRAVDCPPATIALAVADVERAIQDQLRAFGWAPSRPKREYPPRPCGPYQRYGYCGPETPRLPERDWLPLRAMVLERDGYACQYCGNADETMCADHVVPLSRGGSNDPGNLVACCLPCNSSKSDKLLSEWRGRHQ